MCLHNELKEKFGGVVRGYTTRQNCSGIANVIYQTRKKLSEYCVHVNVAAATQGKSPTIS